MKTYFFLSTLLDCFWILDKSLGKVIFTYESNEGGRKGFAMIFGHNLDMPLHLKTQISFKKLPTLKRFGVGKRGESLSVMEWKSPALLHSKNFIKCTFSSWVRKDLVFNGCRCYTAEFHWNLSVLRSLGEPMKHRPTISPHLF